MKLLVLFALLAPPAGAAQLHVPGDFPDLQAAIDAAEAWDVILVSAAQGPVVVDKPLTILGDPSFPIQSGCGFAPSCTTCEGSHAFRLAGSGGKVTLGRFTSSSLDCDYPAAAIGGGGFDELHVFDAAIQIVSGISGLGHGGDAIDVDVPFVVVSGSTVSAAGSDNDSCSGFLYLDESAGIRNPGGTVLLVDSTVNGGNGGLLCCAACGCPPMPDPTLGGQGGPGVVADQVFLAGATVQGGKGATFWAYPAGVPYDPLGTPADCGSQPDGADFVASAVHVLTGTLTGPSTIAPGGTYILRWDLPGPSAFLFFALGVSAPAALPWGFSVLEAETAFLLGAIPAGAPHSLALELPASSALIGIEFGFQAWDSGLGLTRPAVGVVVP